MIFLFFITQVFAALPPLQADAKLWAQQNFVREALIQAERPTASWENGQRDCAGFIRFLYRNGAGVKSWKNRSGKELPFVSAAELVAYNFKQISSEVSKTNIQTGDLLVFHRPTPKPEDAWHLMMVLQAPKGIGKPLVVYHNGDHGEKAAVRKLWLDDLEGEWRADPKNANFQGVFRWDRW